MWGTVFPLARVAGERAIRTLASVSLLTVAALLLSACAGTGSPTASPSVSPSSGTPSASEPAEQTAPLTLYYVAINDNGAAGPLIGCGDSIVATTTAPVRFRDRVEASLQALLAVRTRDIGSDLVNVLYQSQLVVIDSSVSGDTVTVHLDGQIQLTGLCDMPRAKAQLEVTAATAAGVEHAAIFVGEKTLDEVLSLK